MCSLTKSCDIQKMKVYASLPQADAPCLRGRRAVRTGRPPADRQGEPGWPSGNAAETHRKDPPMDSRSRSPCPGGSGGTARMESRAGERKESPGPVHIEETGRRPGPLPLKQYFRRDAQAPVFPLSGETAGQAVLCRRCRDVIRGGGRCAFDVPAGREGDRGVSLGDRASTVWERSGAKWFYEM